jgi:AraC-like DNA-binding protein
MSRAVSVFHGPFGRVSLYELDRPLIKHAHREAHLIFFVGGSPGLLRLDSESVVMNEQNAVAINAWEAHEFEPAGARQCGYFLTFYFNPQWLGHALGATSLTSRLFGEPKITVTPLLSKLRDDICDMLMMDVRNHIDFGQKLQQLLTAIKPKTECMSHSQTRPALTGLDFRLRKSLAILVPGITSEFSIDILAKTSGLSRAHFFSLFRKQVGVTPVVYMNTLRIENALDQVARTNIPITAIGENLGFSYQSAFTRFFSSHVGMPPTDYRRAVQVLGMSGHA